jgi:anthranilate phosphoribosyltransferase
VNSAAALVAAGKVDTFLEGMAISTMAIDTGAARRKLDELTLFTQACG